MLLRIWCGPLLALSLCVWGSLSFAAPYAALVMDARTGQVLHARNADTRLHPASLTKMMTLYVAFEAIERGEISLNDTVRISKHAASEPPSRLGLKSGQRIQIRHLIRATAVKSANDAATALGEAISGSEAAFTRRMTATAKAMGMSQTRFRNAHGLTQKGHYSTARDMAELGRRLLYDHPDYYNLFGRISTRAGNRTVYNTNSRFLQAYRGADGIKTGFTRAAGYNLVGSARRGNQRILASLFGGKSVAWRNARMAELLDMGFSRAPRRARIVKPAPLGPIPRDSEALIASAPQQPKRLPTAIASAQPPLPRGGRQTAPQTPDVEALVARAVMDEEIEDAVQSAVMAAAERDRAAAPGAKPTAGWQTARPPARLRPSLAPTSQVVSAGTPEKARTVAVNTSGDKAWSVHLGSYGSRMDAERHLLVTALQDLSALEGGFRRIDPVIEEGRRVYRARFVGLTRQDAERACARLQTRSETCEPVSPGT